MNAKAEIVTKPQSVVRLTIEFDADAAAELGGLLAHHVDWEYFPWAEKIYDALVLAEVYGKAAFTDSEHGPDVFLVRKRGEANG